MKIRGILFTCLMFLGEFAFSQDHYEHKISLGSSSGNKWYKLSTINLQGSYNSIIVDIDFYYVNTGTRYASKAYLRFREGPTYSNSDWQYTNRGTNTNVLKLKKINSKTYELWRYSSGGWGHISTMAKVVKESSTLSFVLSSTPIVISDLTAYEDVSTKGNWSFPNGNLGIGTSNPGAYKLVVNGKIRAKEIKVETGWADYVFKDDYVLPTLAQVEKHIKEKGHLPNIPSAKEVSEKGIELGEMNKLLLEKIEELTLYTLQQEKRLIQLENLIKNFKK